MRPDTAVAMRAQRVREAMDLHQDLRGAAFGLLDALAAADLARLRGFCLSVDPDAAAALERWLVLRTRYAFAAAAAGIGDRPRGL